MRLEHLDRLDDRELEPLLAQIGNTRMRSISLSIDGRERTVHLKLEGDNPCGSIKDRTALAIVTDMERRGRLGPGSVLLESTSGNVGVALALVARARRHPLVVVVDPKTTSENLARMQALGADVEMIDEADPTGGYLLTRLRRVRELCASSPRFAWTDQYRNPANPLAHYLGTGREIYERMPADVGAVFLPVSTGGTLAGVGRFFREASPETRIVAVDARGSVIFGGPPAPRLLTGIGSSCRSHFAQRHLYDEHILVGDETAFACCRMLADATGIRVGGSSGAVLAAGAEYLAGHPEVHAIVCLCADHGDNYASSIFSDAWLASQGLRASAEHVPWIEDIALLERPARAVGTRR